MNELIINIRIWDKNVGALVWDAKQDIAYFQYEKDFLYSGIDIAPIMMPLAHSNKDTVYKFPENRNICFKGLPGLLADALPDAFGHQIINEWFASRGSSEEQITPLERLCYVGQRAIGALEFEPIEQVAGFNTSSQLHISELLELTNMLFNDRTKFQSKLINQDKSILDILKVGTSAGGAKPKAIIAYNDLTNEVRSGQVKAPEGFTYWLLKFDGGIYEEHSHITDNPKGIGNIEYAYYLMAKDAGIDMMECRLLPEGDSCHFMTKRFDRTDTGEKLHVQTLAGLAHFDRDQRHSYEQAFRAMRQIGLPYPQQEELYRRMVFNVVTRNHDDHTKNHSFIMDKSGKWSLSPAYDLCYSYNPHGRWTNKHQMSINSKQDRFTYGDLQKVAQKMGIDREKEIIGKVVDSVSRWDDFAKDAGVNDVHLKQIKTNLLLLEPKKINSRENDISL